MSEGTLPRAGSETPRAHLLAALSEPNFRRYWVGLVFYVVGWRMEWVAYGWLVWELTRDPWYLGLYGLAEGVPLVLFQLFGGVLADRASRLKLLINTQIVTTITLFVAFVLTATGWISVEWALGLVAISAAFRAFEQPTRMAMVPALVSPALLPNAIAIGSLPWQSGRVIGPSLGGVVIWLLGTAAAFGIAAAFYVIAILLYSRIRLLTAPPGVSHGVLRPLVEGLVFVSQHPLFWNLILLSCFNSVFGMSYITLLPLFADRYLDAGSSGFGLLQGAMGIGAIAGTLTLATFATRLGARGRLLLLGSIGFGLLLMAFSQSPSLLVALVLLLLSGFSNVINLTLMNTLLQEHVPNELRGRVMGLFGISYNLIPLGGLLAGVVAAALDARVAVLLGGAIVALGSLVSLLLNPHLRAIK